jgi:hypothetical protein
MKGFMVVRKIEFGSLRGPHTRLVFALVALVALSLGLAAANPASATKKKAKNPLAGNWVGTTTMTNTYSGAPAPVSYRITNAGEVVNFATTVTLNKQPSGGPCPTPILATVSMPPVRMSKPSETYPKGKRFTFIGTNVAPTAHLYANGKVGIGSKQGSTGFQGFRKMEGAIILGGLGTIEVAPSVICKTGAVYWSANRVGGK